MFEEDEESLEGNGNASNKARAAPEINVFEASDATKMSHLKNLDESNTKVQFNIAEKPKPSTLAVDNNQATKSSL